MKKIALFSTIFAVIFCAINISSNEPVKLNASEDGYVELIENAEAESCFSIVTNSPWVSDTKFLISFDDTQINKNYLALEYEVTLSKDNPELVARIGVNGTFFTGHDNEMFHGSEVDVMKNYGEWFFLPPGRNRLYFPVELFLNEIEQINQFGLFFDTGFDSRSGSSLNIYGLYLLDDYEEEPANSIFTPSDYSTDDERINYVGLNYDIQIIPGGKSISAAWLNGDYIGSLRMHVKGKNEGGKVVDEPDDFGFLSITLNETVDVSNDEGFAFSVFAFEGETYFRIVLEDEEGHFYIPVLYGGNMDNPGSYPFISDGLVVSILHFYGALYMKHKDNGTAYIPYDKFVGLNYMFGEEVAVSSSRISSIKKIHIGMDMKYGLGRELVINQFGTCDAETESVTSILQMCDMSDTEWDRLHFFQSHNLAINGLDEHKSNYVISAVDENHIPGAKEIVDTAELEKAIALAKTLKQEDYTKESWANMLIKLENAENILQFSVLYEQSDCEQATSDLLIAIRKLVPVNTGVENTNKKALSTPMIITIGVAGGVVVIFVGLIIAGFIVGGSAFALFTGKRRNKERKGESNEI